jgi:aminopeptidase YwaD
MADATIESEIEEHLRRLCVEIGPRPIGSPGDHAAADYIRGVFDSVGLEVEEQRFECPAWTEEETRLELDGRVLPAWANAFSPPCEVAASAVAACTIAELEGAELEGRIGLLYGDLTARPLTPRACTLYPAERDWRILSLLEEKRPAALVTVRPRTGLHTRIIEDWNFPIPSATVTPEAGRALLEGAGAPLRLRIATRSAPSHSAHLVGYLRGAREERIVVCAHYDTKVGTPGALDNGAGVAALLSLAQQLAGRTLPVSIEFIAFSAEEYGGSLDDSEYYIRVAGDRLGTILAAINMDGIGYRLGTSTVALMAGSEALQAEVDRLLAGYPGVTWTEPWPQSNHSTFAMRGVPAVAFTSTGAWDLAHQPEDTVDWVGVEKVAEVVSLVGDIVASLQDRTLQWTRPPAEEWPG